MGLKARDPLRSLAVLHRGDGYAVLDKPAGIAVIAERNRPGETPLLDRAAALLEVDRVMPVHRIDRDTSGALVVATTKDALSAIGKLFRRREIDKRYLALVEGTPDAEGVVKAPMEPDPKGGSRMRVATTRARRGEKSRAKRAVTRYRRLVAFRGLSLLEVDLETGRQHQIRVHLRHIGHPLAVDPLYASGDGIFLSRIKPRYRSSRRREETPLCGRLTLHAWKLAFTDPNGREIRVRAPVPADLRRALQALVRYQVTRPARQR